MPKLPLDSIICGDSLQYLKKFPSNSIDAIITDPPYGLEFMGKDWDKQKNLQQFSYNWAKEAIGVLKPGAHMLVFGGTRTYHRMVCGIEDARFEIRDCIQWLYGSGFPKSLNVSKQIDKMKGMYKKGVILPSSRKVKGNLGFHMTEKTASNPQSELAERWEGWGTGLKPANEPIVMARKPLSEKSVALNVLKWGTGGLNIDDCRIPLNDEKNPSGSAKRVFKSNKYTDEKIYGDNKVTPDKGRFPTNVILDEEASIILNEQTGNLKSGYMKLGQKRNKSLGLGGYHGSFPDEATQNGTYGDSGGASRFFYCAKASKKERNCGLEDFDSKGRKTPMAGRGQGGLKCKVCGKWKNSGNPCICANPDFEEMKFNSVPDKNVHPTVKPIKLMEYLIKLVTKEGMVVLDTFIGSGTTAIACLKLNRRFIGIEKEPEYVEIAEARIRPYLNQKKLSLTIS